MIDHPGRHPGAPRRERRNVRSSRNGARQAPTWRWERAIARWGPRLYRAFRLYLWGGSRAFRQDFLQAYSVVAQRRDDPGPRPS